MESWGTQALTRYSCKDFPSKNTWNCLLMRNQEIRPNALPEISWDLSLWRWLAWQTLSKHFE